MANSPKEPLDYINRSAGSDTNPPYGYLKKFEHRVPMNGPAIRHKYAEWCETYCEGLWGWHFEPWAYGHDPKDKLGGGASHSSMLVPSPPIQAIMSFELLDDMLKFKLCCLNG